MPQSFIGYFFTEQKHGGSAAAGTIFPNTTPELHTSLYYTVHHLVHKAGSPNVEVLKDNIHTYFGLPGFFGYI